MTSKELPILWIIVNGNEYIEGSVDSINLMYKGESWCLDMKTYELSKDGKKLNEESQSKIQKAWKGTELGNIPSQ